MGNKVEMGIYQSIWQAKQILEQKTVLIWKLLDPKKIDEPEKKKRLEKNHTVKIKKKYKETRIITTLKSNWPLETTSRHPDYEQKIYTHATFDDLEIFVLK